MVIAMTTRIPLKIPTMLLQSADGSAFPCVTAPLIVGESKVVVETVEESVVTMISVMSHHQKSHCYLLWSWMKVYLHACFPTRATTKFAVSILTS